ncbi:MAG: SDR family NAD(P)-dependent oxidoreductase [Thermoplasmatota archaeon]
MAIDLGLSGRWALVTGGTQGIGRACCAALAEAGANVALFSRDAKRAEAAAAELAKTHQVETLGLACDVARLAAVKAAFETIRTRTHGKLAAVVHTATYPVEQRMWDTELHEMTDADVERWFDEVYAVDVKGSRFVSREAIRLMMPHRDGALVFFSSTPALVGYKGLPYTEAKADILGLMRDVAKGYAKHGIRANAIAPGNIRTKWLEGLSDRERGDLEAEAPLNRLGEPREVANVALFLASPLSSFVTGQTVIVDGGTEMR